MASKIKALEMCLPVTCMSLHCEPAAAATCFCNQNRWGLIMHRQATALSLQSTQILSRLLSLLIAVTYVNLFLSVFLSLFCLCMSVHHSPKSHSCCQESGNIYAPHPCHLHLHTVWSGCPSVLPPFWFSPKIKSFNYTEISMHYLAEDQTTDSFLDFFHTVSHASKRWKN